MLLGEGQILSLPELCFDNVVAMLFGELIVGCAALKQALGILIQRAVLLFQGDDQMPIDFFGQLENRCLRVERIEQQDVEEAAAIELRQSSQQAQRRGVLPLVRANPLERQDGLDRAADHLAAHQAMVILDLLDGLPLLVLGNDPSLQTELTNSD